jgi:hypothetical protein
MPSFRIVLIMALASFVGFNKVIAQQNFVNVPSCEQTPENKCFFQQQMNINRNQIQSNSTFDYGLGKGFELGINLFGINYLKEKGRLETNNQPDNGPLEPQILLNGQKFFRISDHYRLGAGLQAGTTLTEGSGKRSWAAFAYTNLRYAFSEEKLKLVAGVFRANAAYSGEKSHFGLMGGAELRLKKNISLVGDCLWGSPFLNAATLGLIWFARPQLPVTFAWQLPWKDSKNLQAFVLELTYAPLSHLKNHHDRK